MARFGQSRPLYRRECQLIVMDMGVCFRLILSDLGCFLFHFPLLTHGYTIATCTPYTLTDRYAYGTDLYIIVNLLTYLFFLFSDSLSSIYFTLPFLHHISKLTKYLRFTWVSKYHILTSFPSSTIQYLHYLSSHTSSTSCLLNCLPSIPAFTCRPWVPSLLCPKVTKVQSSNLIPIIVYKSSHPARNFFPPPPISPYLPTSYFSIIIIIITIITIIISKTASSPS